MASLVSAASPRRRGSPRRAAPVVGLSCAGPRVGLTIRHRRHRRSCCLPATGSVPTRAQRLAQVPRAESAGAACLRSSAVHGAIGSVMGPLELGVPGLRAPASSTRSAARGSTAAAARRASHDAASPPRLGTSGRIALPLVNSDPSTERCGSRPPRAGRSRVRLRGPGPACARTRVGVALRSSALRRSPRPRELGPGAARAPRGRSRDRGGGGARLAEGDHPAAVFVIELEL